MDRLNNELDNIIQAGRILHDKSLDEISSLFQRKVLDTVSLLKFKTVVFDFDGTLTEFKYNTERLLPCRDDELQEYCKTENLYANAKQLETMQYIIERLDPDDVYVLTVTVDSLQNNKEKFISSKYPTIKKEHIIQVSDSSKKNEVLQRIYDECKMEIVFVEDTAKTLLNAEETLPFVKGIHMSSLIP